MSQVNRKPRVLLVGWDAADWEHITPLLEAGQLPVLESVINQGVMGNLGTLNPMLSPMLWNSIATGKQPYKHGVHGFIEPDPVHGGSRPFSSVSRKCKAIWNILAQEGYRCNVVNWWASHPAERIPNGCIVTNCFHGTRMEKGKWVSPKGSVYPEALAEALASNKVFAEELTGEQLLPFVPRGGEINQDEDNRLAVLANNVSELLTTHAVTTAVMEHQPWDFMATYFTAIDHFSHAFMPYHPPRLPWVGEREFELFKDVINGVYRFSDMTLKRMLELAGPETTVILCSDHGFHSRELRPRALPNEPAGPAYWHRRFGILVVKGAGIKKDTRVVGASLVDITPTILSMYGLPTGEDMDGRPLSEIFEIPPALRTIPSWDAVAGESGMHPGEVESDPAETEELLNQFVALGYIEAPGGTKAEQATLADVESRYNVARNLAWCGKFDEAISLFHGLVKQCPWESRFITQLAKTCVAAGHHKAAEQVVTGAFDVSTTRHVGVLTIWLDILMARRRFVEAHRQILSLEAMQPAQPDVWIHMANHLLRLRAWTDAERVFKGCLAIHPRSAEAFEGLSKVYCHMGLNQETSEAAIDGISIIYRLPQAHLSLGIAMARSGNGDAAAVALENALRIDPNMKAAHRWMAVVCETILNDAFRAQKHKAEVARLERESESAPPARRPDPDALSLDLPDLMNEEERERVLNIKRPPPSNPMFRSGKVFVLVSGLPRSGTSLMMQMLAAGGLPPKTDGERAADVDNPNGYYEWEELKRVAERPEMMLEDGLDQKAIKAISALLPKMPYQHEYRIIFMERPVEEVAESQAAMIERRRTEGAKLGRDELCHELQQHRAQVLRWLEGHPRARHLVIDYPTLVKSPESELARLTAFLGDKLKTPEKMRAVIDQSLYRKRKGA